jgi:hypothetical protein
MPARATGCGAEADVSADVLCANCRACSPAHGLPDQSCWRALHTLQSFMCMQYRAGTVHTWFWAQSTNRIDVSCFGSASNPVRCSVSRLACHGLPVSGKRV